MSIKFFPGCTKSINVNNNMAFLDYAASLSLLGHNTKFKLSEVQEPDRTLGTPSKKNIMTTQTLELLLKNYQRKQDKIFGYQILLTNVYQHVSWSM